MLKNGTVEEYIKEGTKLTKASLTEVDLRDADLKTLRVKSSGVNDRIRAAIDAANAERAKIEEKAEDQIDKILQPDELPPGVIQLVKVYLAEKRKISVGDKMAGRHGNKGIIARVVPEEDMPILPDGQPVEIVLNPLGVPSRMNVGQVLETTLGWAAGILGFEANTPVFQGATEHEIGALLKIAGAYWAARTLGADVEPPAITHELVQTLTNDIMTVEGDPVGASAGIGRSIDAYTGFKGETGEFFQDLAKFVLEASRSIAGGTTATKLKEGGWTAAAKLSGQRKVTEGLDAAVVELMEQAGLRASGKMRLRDGRTGDEFDADVTVGQIYMMKLSHLVDDKIHARSIGPYSLVTQQPLAGKAQFGGQRFGEMEVWALEAYGAAHTLQEMLTVKSDDVTGRSRVYEAIVKGDNLPKPGVPESFNVLVKELQALGLSVTLGTDEGDSIF
jgi:DNA-directed RNA polymerase subunit beta